MIRSLARYHPAMLGACLVAAAAVACTDNPPTAPTPQNAVFAKGAGGAGPKVSSTDPSSGARNTTLFVRVLGSGYSQGTRAVWALKGDTTFAVTRVKTNSTTFVSSTELVANITIQGDASLALYDVVAITAAGKKGIGIELFTVIVGITDLGTLGGGQSFAYAVNADGVIVGEADQTGGRRAVRWTVTNGVPRIEDLTTVASFPAGTTRSGAYDVNNSGLIAGTMENAIVRRAFLLAGNVVTDLGVLPGDSHSTAAALNDANPVQVVGQSGASAVLWTVGTVATMQALPHLSLVGGSSWATGLNGTGTVVVGYSYVPSDLSYSAVRWQQVGGVWTVTELPSGDFAGATDLNERGDATGSRRSATGTAHAYLWPTDGGSVDLGTLGGSTSHALGINGGGETVGWSYNRVGVTRAFWSSGSGMTDLGTLISSKNGASGAATAEAINDAGLVVGSSQSTGGSGAIWHAVVWTTR